MLNRDRDQMTRLGLRCGVAAIALALALPAAPVLLSFAVQPAFAKDGGGDHGGGGGGGGGGRDGGSDRGTGQDVASRGRGDADAGKARGHAAEAAAHARAEAREHVREQAREEAREHAREEARERLVAAARVLGRLNAAHASPVAFAHANPHSAVGEIAAYRAEMIAALKITDPVARQAAIDMARTDLARASNKSLTPAAVARIDALLGLPASPPSPFLVAERHDRDDGPVAR